MAVVHSEAENIVLVQVRDLERERRVRSRDELLGSVGTNLVEEGRVSAKERIAGIVAAFDRLAEADLRRSSVGTDQRAETNRTFDARLGEVAQLSVDDERDGFGPDRLVGDGEAGLWPAGASKVGL